MSMLVGFQKDCFVDGSGARRGDVEQAMTHIVAIVREHNPVTRNETAIDRLRGSSVPKWMAATTLHTTRKLILPEYRGMVCASGE
jgi:hypothetical protein